MIQLIYFFTCAAYCAVFTLYSLLLFFFLYLKMVLYARDFSCAISLFFSQHQQMVQLLGLD